MRKYFAFSLIIILSLLGLWLLASLLFFNIRDMDFKVIISPIALICFSLLGFCAVVLYERRNYTVLSVIGLGSSIIGLLTAFLLIFEVVDGRSYFWEILLMSMIILSASIAQVSLVLFTRTRKQVVLWLQGIAIGLIVIVGLLLEYLVIKSVLKHEPTPIFYKVLTSFVICDVILSIIAPLSGLLYSERR